jgi:hypothetical protein
MSTIGERLLPVPDVVRLLAREVRRPLTRAEHVEAMGEPGLRAALRDPVRWDDPPKLTTTAEWARSG